MAHKEQLLMQMRNAAVIIDHDYDRNRPGYTAQAAVIDIPGGSSHIITAAHNIRGDTVLLFNPMTERKSNEPFAKYTPDDAADTGISRRPYPEILGERTALKTGEPVSQGDNVLLLSLRHQGNGEFTEHTIEGEIAEDMYDLEDNNWYPSFHIISGSPKLGDSGAMVVPVTRNGIPQTKAEVIGVFRGGETRGRFSPVPQEIVERTRKASEFYNNS